MEIEDNEKLKATSISNYKKLDADATVGRFFWYLKQNKFIAYYDHTMHCLAVELPKEELPYPSLDC